MSARLHADADRDAATDRCADSHPGVYPAVMQDTHADSDSQAHAFTDAVPSANAATDVGCDVHAVLPNADADADRNTNTVTHIDTDAGPRSDNESRARLARFDRSGSDDRFVGLDLAPLLELIAPRSPEDQFSATY